jgi:hypothetical protein
VVLPTTKNLYASTPGRDVYIRKSITGASAGVSSSQKTHKSDSRAVIKGSLTPAYRCQLDLLLFTTSRFLRYLIFPWGHGL